MATVTVIKLFNEPAYTADVALEGESFTLRFYVNARTQLYHFDVINALSQPVALGLTLLPELEIYPTTGMKTPPSGFFYLAPLNPEINFTEISPSEISEKFAFFYLTL